MKTTLAVFLAIIGLTHAEPAKYELEIRVLASAIATDEWRTAELKDNPKYVHYSIPNIELSLGDKKFLSIPDNHRLSPHPTNETSESCEILLTSESEGKFKINCEWLISTKKGNTVTTEHRNYTRTLSLNQWDFSHYGQEDAQGRERYLGFYLTR